MSTSRTVDRRDRLNDRRPLKSPLAVPGGSDSPDMLHDMGHDPVVLRGGMGAKDRAAALARLRPEPGAPPLLAVATGPYAGEGFDCPALDTLPPWRGRELPEYATNGCA